MKILKYVFTFIFLQTLAYAQMPTIENKNVKIQALDIHTKIIGNTAVTTITYVFQNPTNRDLEAKLTFPLPEGTTISAYAIDINGKMRKAVPVPKERGKEVFESIQHRQVDPGLIEKVSGNNFRTKISPVPAKGFRTMTITFLQELKNQANGKLEYYLPLNNQVYPEFDLKIIYINDKNAPNFIENPDGTLAFVNTSNQWIATLDKKNYTPNSGIRIELPQLTSTNSIFQKTETSNQFYFINAIKVPLEAQKKQLPKNIAIIWDNSFSAMSKDFNKEWELLNNYILQLPKNSTIELYYLNNEFEKIQTFSNTNSSIGMLKNILENTTYDGATDFSKLRDIPEAKTVLLFSDGISSFGNVGDTFKNKYYCITSLPKSDYSTLRFISEKSGGYLINLNELNPQKALELLTTNPIQFLGTINANNVREIYPSKGIVSNNEINLSGILTANQGSYTALFGIDDKETLKIDINLQPKEDLILPGFNVAQIWAQKKINELEINYLANKKEISLLSNQFSVVSKNTSLIVLENIEDYVKYEITPPDELLASYNQLITQKKREYAANKKSILNRIAQKTQELKNWHSTDFSTKTEEETKYPKVKLQSANSNILNEVAITDSYEGEGEYDGNTEGESKDIRGKIILSEISSNADYMADFKKLQSAKEIYALYLTKREQYKYNTTFYFDISKLLYPKNKNLAMKVLSTLADLDLENEELFKTLHYVLSERGENEKDLWVTQKILEWRPFDPQSHRDYALALLENKRPQEAIDVYRALIYQDFTEELSTRDYGIEEILVMEINNIISQYPEVSTEKVNKAFIADLPVDIRVVLNWNKDHTDIDLWITDPDKEECFYGHRNTKSGGRLSNDFTNGFGPEQFILKKAKKGTYLIKTNFFAERQISIGEPTAIMAEIYLYYSSGKQEKKTIVFLNDNSDANSSNDDDRKTLVGKFIF